MSDLRTAAQAVIDAFARREADDDGREVIPIHAVFANIEALRQALAAPVEPVETQYKCFKDYGDGDIGFAWLTNSDMEVMYNWKKCSPVEKRGLYTTPPSVDALIAEAVAKEREACAQIALPNWRIAEEIRARGQE